MASNIEIIARNRAMLIQTVTTSLDMLENHPRVGAKAFRDAWNGAPVEDKEQAKRASGGVHAACFLSSGYILDDSVLVRPAAKVVLEHAGFIARVLDGDLDGVFKHLGLHEDACLGEDWAAAATDLIKETMDEYSSIAYVFADDNEDRIKFFIESFNKELYYWEHEGKYPYTFTGLTDEDYRQNVVERETLFERMIALDKAEKTAKAAKQDQPQLQGKEETMTEQVTEQTKAQPEAATDAVDAAAAQAAVAAFMDSYIEKAKAAGKAEAVEGLTFFKDVAVRCAGLDDRTAASVAAAMAETEMARRHLDGQPVPAWLTDVLAKAKAAANGQSTDDLATEGGFESFLSKLTEGVSEDAKERVRPILAEHVKNHLPAGEPAPAFLDKAIQEGDKVVERQAVKAAQAAAAAGMSESSAIAAQRIVLTEDRAKIRSALADIKEYDSAKGAADHQVEVVRSYVIATGNGGSSRASEPLFSDEFVETCGNIAKVALGTAVVVGTAYLAYRGAKAAYEWFTE